MDEELAAVKTELSRLKGKTVYTIPRERPNHIVDISPQRGFHVRATSTPNWVRWEEVLGAYAKLRENGQLEPDQSKRSRGAFCRAVLVQLTTVEVAQRHGPPTLQYLPTGKPPRLRQD